MSNVESMLQAKVEAQIAKVEKNLEKYPHAIAETLTWDAAARKYKVQIRCASCESEERFVFTSDLFQITRCKPCSDKAKAERKAKAREELAQARKLVRDGAL